MSGTLHKKMSVAEQILVVLMMGPSMRTVSHSEILGTLNLIAPERIPTYMWELKKRGALITRAGSKQNTTYTLTNRETMLAYLQGRRNAGAIVPDLIGLTKAVAPTATVAVPVADAVESNELVAV